VLVAVPVLVVAEIQNGEAVVPEIATREEIGGAVAEIATAT
jgi:hypothetical protein